MKYLLDTNILSELVRPRPDAGFLARAGLKRIELNCD